MDFGRIIMLCGLPGAGKTTYAKKLENNLNAVRMCPDEWVVKFMKDKTSDQENERYRDIVEGIQWDLALRLAKLGDDIIVENGFWSEQDRSKYAGSANKENIRVELHYLKADFETLWERVEGRNKNLPESNFRISRFELKGWYEDFEEPTDAEKELFTSFKTIFT